MAVLWPHKRMGESPGRGREVESDSGSGRNLPLGGIRENSCPLPASPAPMASFLVCGQCHSAGHTPRWIWQLFPHSVVRIFTPAVE